MKDNLRFSRPYKIDKRLALRYSVIYDRLAGRGVLDKEKFPRWLYNDLILKPGAN